MYTGSAICFQSHIYSHKTYNLNFTALFGVAADKAHPCGRVSWKLTQNLCYFKNGEVFSVAWKNHWVTQVWAVQCSNRKKFIFTKFFHNKSYFFMSNLNSECSQLWFGMNIVHIAQKMLKLIFSPMNFSRPTLVTSAPSYRQSIQHRTGFKVSTGR